CFDILSTKAFLSITPWESALMRPCLISMSLDSGETCLWRFALGQTHRSAPTAPRSVLSALCAFLLFSAIDADNYDCRIAERPYLSNQPSVTVFHNLRGNQTQPDSMKIFFPHSSLIASHRALELKQGEIIKHGDPVICPEHPWEENLTYL